MNTQSLIAVSFIICAFMILSGKTPEIQETAQIGLASLAENYSVYDKHEKEIRKTKFKEHANIHLDKTRLINGNTCYKAELDDAIVYIPRSAILDKDTIERFQEANKPIVNTIPQAIDLKTYNVDGIEPYVKKLPQNISNEEALRQAIQAILDLNFDYYVAEDNDQVRTMKDGKTACYGVLLIQKALLDQTNLKYRIVMQSACNLKTGSIVDKGSHISMDIFIDDKWYAFDATYLLNQENYKVDTVEKALETIKSQPVDDPGKRIMIAEHDEENPGTIFTISGIIQRNRYVDDKTTIIEYPGLSFKEFTRKKERTDHAEYKQKEATK